MMNDLNPINDEDWVKAIFKLQITHAAINEADAEAEGES